jgi:hypothetical protein
MDTKKQACQLFAADLAEMKKLAKPHLIGSHVSAAEAGRITLMMAKEHRKCKQAKV